MKNNTFCMKNTYSKSFTPTTSPQLLITVCRKETVRACDVHCMWSQLQAACLECKNRKPANVFAVVYHPSLYGSG